jgi:hypothetical protein
MSLLAAPMYVRQRNGVTMEYREALPPDCPPESSEEIVNTIEVYRLVASFPPTDDDFRSQRDLKPVHVFRDIQECQARGLSVHLDIKDSVRTLKLPSQRGRTVCCVKLNSGAGRIMQTGKPSHHTWWPLRSFDILGSCKGEAT